jgi:xanthine/uracil permease
MWAAMSHSNVAGTRFWEMLLLIVGLAVMLAAILFARERRSRFPIVLGILAGIATFLVLGATASPAQVAVAGLIGLLLMMLWESEWIL